MQVPIYKRYKPIRTFAWNADPIFFYSKRFNTPYQVWMDICVYWDTLPKHKTFKDKINMLLKYWDSEYYYKYNLRPTYLQMTKFIQKYESIKSAFLGLPKSTSSRLL